MRESGVCLVSRPHPASTYTQFEGWSSGILDERIAQAMLSGCVVAAVQPDVQHGEFDRNVELTPRRPRPAHHPSHPFTGRRVAKRRAQPHLGKAVHIRIEAKGAARVYPCPTKVCAHSRSARCARRCEAVGARWTRVSVPAWMAVDVFGGRGQAPMVLMMHSPVMSSRSVVVLMHTRYRRDPGVVILLLKILSPRGSKGTRRKRSQVSRILNPPLLPLTISTLNSFSILITLHHTCIAARRTSDLVCIMQVLTTRPNADACRRRLENVSPT